MRSRVSGAKPDANSAAIGAGSRSPTERCRQLDVAGFDAAAPAVIADFIRE